ncbi:MAG: hypothetical protein P1V20_00955 [Verrucomicrobiales bacterium]|nr:hypothetical protein [Verrucomicrobiales bacterium]
MSNFFPDTRWSLVKMARDPRTEVAERALEELWSIYEIPIRKTLQRTCPRGLDPDDLVQDFFLHSRRSKVFERADNNIGSLRSYLGKILENFLRTKIKFEKRECRDRSRLVHIEDIRTDGEFPPEEWDGEQFYRVYDREWATDLVRSVRGKLQDRYRARGKEELFLRLFPFIGTATGEITDELEAIETDLSVSKEHLSVLRSRMRKRFQIAFAEAVRETLPAGEDWEDESKYLRRVLAES